MSLDLRGKDYLTANEAAHYACVSLSQFQRKAGEYGLAPFRWMGKLVYRKADIQAAMENEWRRYTSGGNPGISSGRKAGNVTALP